jgi:Bifunctional DNA primase/polymerase, N-terminal/Primase C terminal 1 (PriCT-1)
MQRDRTVPPPILRAALGLASRGLAVFPCKPSDKEPATFHGFKDASRDPAIIVNWWQRNPHYNLAIATGAPSGVFVVDIDGMDAEAEMRQLEAIHNEPLPATIETITARGRHLYFRYQPDRPVRNSTDHFETGAVHVRGDGGYVLVPPSVHPSGRRYAWSVDCTSEFADAPEWLIEKIAVRASGHKSTTSPEGWRKLVAQGVAEGQRNNAITRISGMLLRRYVDPYIVLDLMQVWNATRCKPPLSPNEVEQVVGSVARLERNRRQGHA